MADDDRGGFAQGLHQADDVTHRLAHVVGLDRSRAVGHAETSQVRSDHPIASSCQGRDLSSPHVPEVGESMQEDDQRPLAFLDVVHPDAVHINEVVGERVRSVYVP
ncbi:hypothetical protein D3C80_1019840 [compost metagenome]